jgi:hypothetical protein
LSATHVTSPTGLARGCIALQDLVVDGVKTMAELDLIVLTMSEFAVGGIHTRSLEDEWLGRFPQAVAI